MTKVKLPYAQTFLELEVPEAQLLGILESNAHKYQPDLDQEDLVNRALDNPIDSPTLEALTENKGNIVIITSDHTRPVPSRVTMPILLERIRKGSPNARITILLATGYHRASTKEEIVFKFGEKIAAEERIISHDCRDKDSLQYMGALPSQADLYLNKMALEADLLIAEGFIEPHFFAGFSGGRKSILPGIAGERTVLANHCSKFIASKNCRTGVLDGNPMHEDMLEATRRAGLSFVLNVVINAEKEVISAFAGDPFSAHTQGCEFVNKVAQVKAEPADIVVTTNGGYPLDQNIYQTVKGMTAAEAAAKDGGVIIIASACNDGHGGEGFYRAFLEARNAEEVLTNALATSMQDTVPDQWESQILARVLTHHPVIVVTDQCDPKLIKDMKLLHAYSLEEALDQAYAIKGKEAKINVIPDGVSVIVNC